MSPLLPSCSLILHAIQFLVLQALLEDRPYELGTARLRMSPFILPAGFQQDCTKEPKTDHLKGA